jgi:hypothetical protein
MRDKTLNSSIVITLRNLVFEFHLFEVVIFDILCLNILLLKHFEVLNFWLQYVPFRVLLFLTLGFWDFFSAFYSNSKKIKTSTTVSTHDIRWVCARIWWIHLLAGRICSTSIFIRESYTIPLLQIYSIIHLNLDVCLKKHAISRKNSIKIVYNIFS